MANEVSRAEYSALLDRHQSVIDQIRAHGGEVSEQDGALSVALPKASQPAEPPKPSEALKKANAAAAEAQIARDELAKVAADARERADAAEAKAAELQRMLDELTAPPAQPANG